MDYKYIDQLLERYWNVETTLEEEDILRTFFNQAQLPARLEQYRPLFACQKQDLAENKLGEDFDKRILAMTEDSEKPQKTRIISLKQRLRPLFRAAAMVAVVLAIGQAAQVPFSKTQDRANTESAAENTFGTSVAIQKDSAVIDSMRQSNLQIAPSTQMIMPNQQE